jgi:hypothetical protein
VGASAEGRPIELLSIGNGRRPALLVGVPHPNEPIGTLTFEFLCRLFCEDAALREGLGGKDYLRRTPKRLAAERAHAAAPEYAREATRAEALDATACRAFYHVPYQGEVFRIADMVGDHALADELRARLTAIVGEIEAESALRVLPIRPLVAVEAGAGLLALAHT